MSGSTQPQLRHDITPHLPKDKLDYESVEALLNYPNPADPVPLIPSLLEWLQDVNWPIFTPVSMVLLRSLADLIAPVRQVLRGDDDEWVYNVIAHLMPLMEREILCQLKEDVLDVRRRVKQGILSPDWDWEVEVDSFVSSDLGSESSASENYRRPSKRSRCRTSSWSSRQVAPSTRQAQRQESQEHRKKEAKEESILLPVYAVLELILLHWIKLKALGFNMWRPVHSRGTKRA